MEKSENNNMNQSKIDQDSDKPLFQIHQDSLESIPLRYDISTDYDAIPDKESYIEKQSMVSEDDITEGHKSEERSQGARFSETLEQHLLEDMSQFLAGNIEQKRKQQETNLKKIQTKELESSKTDTATGTETGTTISTETGTTTGTETGTTTGTETGTTIGTTTGTETGTTTRTTTRTTTGTTTARTTDTTTGTMTATSELVTAFGSTKTAPDAEEESTEMLLRSTPSEHTEQKRLPMSLLLSQAKKEFDEVSESLDTNIEQISQLIKFQQSVAAKTAEEMRQINKYGDMKNLREKPTHSTDFKDETLKGKMKALREAAFNETKFLEERSTSSVDVSDASKIIPEDELPKNKLLYKDIMKIVLKIGDSPTHSERFLNVDEYSKLFVDRLTAEALESKIIERGKLTKDAEYAEQIEKRKKSFSTESFNMCVRVLELPTIDQFTVESGNAKINEYLSYWQFEEDWVYCINFLCEESDTTCNFYRYEVIFSIPCKQYPIAQATASVYFTFEVSRIRPRNCLVDVYYNFEGQRLIHKPGKFKCHEKWLFNIVDAKIKFYKTLTF